MEREIRIAVPEGCKVTVTVEPIDTADIAGKAATIVADAFSATWREAFPAPPAGTTFEDTSSLDATRAVASAAD